MTQTPSVAVPQLAATCLPQSTQSHAYADRRNGLATCCAPKSMRSAESLILETKGIPLHRKCESKQTGNALSLKGREFVISFWEFAAFLANSIVFLLIGIDVAAMPFESYGLRVLLASVALMLLGRGLVVYPLSFLFHRSRWAISLREQHVLWWGGLRGALGLALALSLPPTLALRHEIVGVTFGVVAFSIVVQGLTMPFLLRKLGFLPNGAEPPSP